MTQGNSRMRPRPEGKGADLREQRDFLRGLLTRICVLEAVQCNASSARVAEGQAEVRMPSQTQIGRSDDDRKGA